MAKLLGRTSKWVHAHREEAVFKAQELYKSIILLKGSETLVGVELSNSEQLGFKKKLKMNFRLNKIFTGTPALSKAGTGDVLSGMIAAFLAQGLSPEASACAAAFIHGLAARDWQKKSRDVLGLLATDLLVEIPETIFQIRQKR
jgi:NAD(P)H-hydrate epimerase